MTQRRYMFMFSLLMALISTVALPSSVSAFAIGASTGWAYTPSANHDNGSETSIYMGQSFNLLVLQLQPEFGGSLVTLGDAEGGRVFAGGRAWLGGVLQPGALLHFGYASIANANGFSWDAGGLLDLSLADVFKAGLHVIYTDIAASKGSIEWLNLGIHAQLSF